MHLQSIQSRIYEIRGQKVMLDYDLADLYESETKRLKEAVRRNIDCFPEDFMPACRTGRFQLSKDEYNSLRSQFASLETGRGKYSKFNPFAFTEQGVALLASVLKSTKAIQVNIQIVRAFVMIRQYAFNYKELSDRLKEVEGRFPDIYEAINYLMEKDKITVEQKERKRIGFKNTDDC